MDESKVREVSAALLGFGMLDEAQRRAFADRLNDFVYDSPQGQLRLMEDWSSQCLESENPAARMIAETSATYVAIRRKPRKGKRRR